MLGLLGWTLGSMIGPCQPSPIFCGPALQWVQIPVVPASMMELCWVNSTRGSGSLPNRVFHSGVLAFSCTCRQRWVSSGPFLLNSPAACFGAHQHHALLECSVMQSVPSPTAGSSLVVLCLLTSCSCEALTMVLLRLLCSVGSQGV